MPRILISVMVPDVALNELIALFNYTRVVNNISSNDCHCWTMR